MTGQDTEPSPVLGTTNQDTQDRGRFRVLGTGAIDRLAPISLAELLAEAELLTRFDRKYVLDRREADEVLQRLEPGTRV